MGAPGTSASLDEWLGWLEHLSPREIDLGLDRVRTVLARLDLPRPTQVLTIGGTNGKGSTVAMLESLIAATGLRVGSYTSPHVLHYGERIRVDGCPSGEAAVVAALERVEAVRGDVPLTYFEFGTLAALDEFAHREVDTQILEVGLGGRLDAVNAVDADGCLITNVSLDHCDWLGDDVETIAAEKAGIMRAGRPVVYGSAPMPDAIPAAADSIGAELIAAGRDFEHVSVGDAGWEWHGRSRSLQGLAEPRLAGAHQLDNAAAALALLEALDMTDVLTRQIVNTAFARLALPGRTQSRTASDTARRAWSPARWPWRSL